MSRIVSIGVALAMAAGCGDTTGTGGTGEGGAGQGGFALTTGGFDPGCGHLAEQFTEPGCGDCAEGACCDELFACDAGTECADLLDCIALCEDATCQSDCETANPGGVADSDALNGCLAGSCSEPCNLISEGLCGTEFTTLIQECDDCIGVNCCTPLNDCIADTTCAGCLDDASDPACATDPLLADVEDCFSTSCSDVCDG